VLHLAVLLLRWWQLFLPLLHSCELLVSKWWILNQQVL
jgi:hypothetical protein